MRKEGKVKWFDTSKGFGFISSDGVDYFVHYKQIGGSGFKNLIEAQSVTFSPAKGARGDIAENVIVLE